MNRIIGLSLICLFLISCTTKEKELKVLQLNIWQEGTMINGGFDAIVDQIESHTPDIVLLSEVRNYNDVDFVQKLTVALKERDCIYFAQSDQSIDVATLSKFPITEQTVIGRNIDPRAGVLKTKIQMDEHMIIAYSAHLDYTNYACLLPRGYSGTTWKQLDVAITDSDSIETANKRSMRDEAIQGVIADVNNESDEAIIILGGDFNEPSHLDWTEETKNLYDHNGAVVNWDCSSLLSENGFLDSYRQIYPNPVTHPGFTFPANNSDADLKRLVWAPTADERDRIDFIYFIPNRKLELKDVHILGPVGDIAYGKRVVNIPNKDVIEPIGIWPSDHKGLLALFAVKGN